MSARHYYRLVAGSLVEETTYVPREGWQVTSNAEEGSVGSGSMIVIDSAKALDFTGHRRWLIVESESESTDDILWCGYTGAQEISRGEDGETFEPLGRVWGLELYDINTLWSRRVMTGTDCKRPAETDVARMQWLLATNEASPWVLDITTYVSTANPVNMDKADYRGQMFNAIADDCAQQSGKNWFFAHIRNTTPGDPDTRAFYGDYTYDSPLYLSNDPADWVESEIAAGTSLVWPYSESTKLKRDPSRVFSGGYLQWEKGAIYRQRAATETAFALGNRDMIVPADNVKTKTKAIARVNRALLDVSTQDERINTTVRLPKAKATKLKAGMRVYYKATHQPGYTSWVRVRILSATYRPVQAGYFYDIDLVLQGPGTAAYHCSTAIAAKTSDTATGLESGGNTASVSSTISATGYVIAVLCADNGNTPNAENMGNPSGYTVLNNQPDLGRMTFSVSYKAVSAGTTTASATFTRGFSNSGAWAAGQAWLPWSSVTVVQQTDPAASGASPITFGSPVTPGNTILMFAFSDTLGTPAPGVTSGAPTTGWTTLFHVESGAAAGEGIANVTCFARCVQSGDGQVYDHNGGTGLMTAKTYLVELATT